MSANAQRPDARRPILALQDAHKAGPVHSGSAEIKTMHNIIYIVGLVVIVIFILGFIGLR